MLVIAILQLLGLIALGALIGLTITPFILYLSQIVAYVFALIAVLLRATLTSKLTPKKAFNTFPKLLKEFPKYTDKPIYEGNNSKATIKYPNPIKDIRQFMVDRSIVSVNGESIAHTCGHADYRPNNQNIYDTPKQPIIKKILNTTLNLFHSVILFYKEFYGHSTKGANHDYTEPQNVDV